MFTVKANIQSADDFLSRNLKAYDNKGNLVDEVTWTSKVHTGKSPIDPTEEADLSHLNRFLKKYCIKGTKVCAVTTEMFSGEILKETEKVLDGIVR